MAYKVIKMEVDQSVVSLVDKDVMRTLLDGIYETIRVHHKALLGMKIAEATVTAERLAVEARDRGEEILVLSLEIGADGKVAKKILEKIKAVYPIASVFIASLDEDEEKIGGSRIMLSMYDDALCEGLIIVMHLIMTLMMVLMPSDVYINNISSYIDHHACIHLHHNDNYFYRGVSRRI